MQDGSRIFAVIEDTRKLVRQYTGRRFYRSSQRQMLLARLEQTLVDVDLVFGNLPSRDASHELENDQRAIACIRLIEEAGECFKGSLQSARLWALIHAIDEVLLLVMSWGLLTARAVQVLAHFDSSVRDPALRREWLESGQLRNVRIRVNDRAARSRFGDEAPAATTPTVDSLDIPDEGLREALRIVQREVNKVTDNGFWYLNASVAVKIWSAAVLFGCFVAMIALGRGWARDVCWSDWLGMECREWDIGLIATAMSGAGGASASTLLTSERLVMSIGATTRHYLYHVLAKPVVGAFAAVMVLLLEQSRLVFEFVVASSGKAATVNRPIISIAVPNASAEYFAHAILALVAGFAAERVVRATVDAMLERTYGKAEKVLKTAHAATS